MNQIKREEKATTENTLTISKIGDSAPKHDKEQLHRSKNRNAQS